MDYRALFTDQDLGERDIGRNPLAQFLSSHQSFELIEANCGRGDCERSNRPPTINV
jgi:hypothetical protein